MKHQPGRTAFGAALLFIILLLSLSSRQPQADSSTPPAGQAPPAQTSAALFPEIDHDQITDVVIHTPQSVYKLRRTKDKAVSVNGHRGDTEVFATLLNHIAGIPFSPTQPFSTQDEPLLTLTIRQHQTEYTASFYSDDETGRRTRVIAAKGGSVQYGRTDGWRVGTLMLVCEGVRIQDASGRETPAE